MKKYENFLVERLYYRSIWKWILGISRALAFQIFTGGKRVGITQNVYLLKRTIFYEFLRSPWIEKGLKMCKILFYAEKSFRWNPYFQGHRDFAKTANEAHIFATAQPVEKIESFKACWISNTFLLLNFLSLLYEEISSCNFLFYLHCRIGIVRKRTLFISLQLISNTLKQIFEQMITFAKYDYGKVGVFRIKIRSLV